MYVLGPGVRRKMVQVKDTNPRQRPHGSWTPGCPAHVVFVFRFHSRLLPARVGVLFILLEHGTSLLCLYLLLSQILNLGIIKR